MVMASSVKIVMGSIAFAVFWVLAVFPAVPLLPIEVKNHRALILVICVGCHTILLLGGHLAASAAAISTAEEKKSWLILAWVSTVAGNLSLLGSAVNLIVCKQARHSPHLGYTLSFWSHLKFGIISTVVVTAIGLILIR